MNNNKDAETTRRLCQVGLCLCVLLEFYYYIQQVKP